jgi:hypothetical protein
MATKAAREAETTERDEEQGDGPLLDSVSAAVKKLVAKGKERGYITIDELNAAMPQEQVSSEQIEDTMTMMSELGINVIDGDDVEDGGEAKDGDSDGQVAVGGNLGDDDMIGPFQQGQSIESDSAGFARVLPAHNHTLESEPVRSRRDNENGPPDLHHEIAYADVPR